MQTKCYRNGKGYSLVLGMEVELGNCPAELMFQLAQEQLVWNCGWEGQRWQHHRAQADKSVMLERSLGYQSHQ